MDIAEGDDKVTSMKNVSIQGWLSEIGFLVVCVLFCIECGENTFYLYYYGILFAENFINFLSGGNLKLLLPLAE